jgi:hypothetical protein
VRSLPKSWKSRYCRARVALEYGETDAYPDEWLDDDRYDHDPTIRTLRFAGFELAYPRRATVADARHDSNGSLLLPYVLVTPAWTVALLFALLPTLRLAGWWRKRPRFGAGRCSACSYDLAGNVSGVCPECGTPVAAHPSEAPPCP